MSIEIVEWDRPFPADCRGGAVTIGNFDGVHRGHAALVAEVKRQAKQVSGPAVALTFEPHPLQLLRPELFQPILTTAGDRVSLLREAGADRVLALRTCVELLHLSAGDFFNRVIGEHLDARAVVEGLNFGFGHNREGTVDTLARLCQATGRRMIVVPPVLMDGKAISSSRVRNLLLAGAVREAALYLNRLYRIRATVVTGRQRGRDLGFPTANLEQILTLTPRDGVYAVIAHHEGKPWPAAANLGPNPTFQEEARKVEVHLIGFNGSLVGKTLAVDFVERLRDTRPFENVGQLVEQLNKDIEQARRITEQRIQAGC